LRTQSVHRIPHSTFVTTRNAPPDECRTVIALLLFLANEKAKYFFAEDWTRRANQVDGIYQQRHARMFKRLRCRRATIGCYVGPLSSSAKAYWMPRLRGA